MLLREALRIRPKEIIALTGGGGKTTLMFRLADELTAQGAHVVTTMTTRIFVGQMKRAPAHLVLDREEALLARLPAALAQHRHVLVAGGVIVELDKVEGIPPALVGRIASELDVQAVIVEADGSRRLPLKAPAAHEPVVPPATTIVVPVAGLDVLGLPLAAGNVHRPELVAELTGAALGDPVTPEMVAAALAHPLGGAKGLPPSARLVPFLNKADEAEAGAEARVAAAREIARRLLASQHVDSVIIGAAEATTPVREAWGRVTAVVLAAGAGRRFGALKQVQPWQGRTLVAHVAHQALACPDIDHVIVTTGAEAEQVRRALLEGLPGEAARLEVVPVEDWGQGQSASVRAGLAAARTGPEPAAVLFLLADQPGVTPALLSALVARHRNTLAPVVAPRYAGQRGNPVLFDRNTWPDFAALQGDIGARPVIAKHRDAISWLDWPTPEIIQDVDTPEDYRAARE